MLTITDHLGWTQEDDNDVDVIAFIRARTPDPIPLEVLKKERKQENDKKIKMDKFLAEYSKQLQTKQGAHNSSIFD